MAMAHKRCRIVERTLLDGTKMWVIQQKYFLFKWWWVDAWFNSSLGAMCQDSFFSLEDAQKNLCYFDGSDGVPDKIIHDNNVK